MNIIIGKSGQLAQALKRQWKNAVCLGRDDINLSNESDVFKSLAKYAETGSHEQTYIINAAAYTAVDQAESEIEQAMALNAQAVRYLGKAAKELNAHLVHVSTDYVFAGSKGSPYLPSDPVAPINAYGKSKQVGEQILLSEYANNACVMRTSWVYSEAGKNFVKTMLSLMQTKPQLTVIDDQIGSPTSAHTLATACIMAAESRLTGIHHCTDEGVCSWYDFAKVIQAKAIELNLLDKAVDILPVPSSQFITQAKRPHYSVMSKESLKEALPTLHLPYWQEALVSILQDLKRN